MLSLTLLSFRSSHSLARLALIKQCRSSCLPANSSLFLLPSEQPAYAAAASLLVVVRFFFYFFSAASVCAHLLLGLAPRRPRRAAKVSARCAHAPQQSTGRSRCNRRRRARAPRRGGRRVICLPPLRLSSSVCLCKSMGERRGGGR